MISLCVLLFLFNCKPIKNEVKNSPNTKKECFKLYNQENLDSINDFYNDNVKENYISFTSSTNEIDIFLVVTGYGYSIKQEYYRLYTSNGESYTSSELEKNKIISRNNVDDLINLYSFKEKRNLYINCPETSSKAIRTVLLFKINNKLVFSFDSNQKIEDLDIELSKDEILFLRKFKSIFK